MKKILPALFAVIGVTLFCAGIFVVFNQEDSGEVLITGANETSNEQVFVHPYDGYRFTYPNDWKLETIGPSNGQFYLENFPYEVELGRKGWKEGENRIEVLERPLNPDSISDWDTYTKETIGGRVVYTKPDGLPNNEPSWLVVAIPLQDDLGRVLIAIIYGDTETRDETLSTFLENFMPTI